MKLLSSALSTLALATSTALAQSSCYAANEIPCLGPAEASNIATRWLNIFQTDSNGTSTGIGLITTLIADNFTYFDEGASFGDSAPLYTSRQALYESIAGSGYSGALVTDVTYQVLFSFSSCDIVGLRWQHDSLSANATGVTVPIGTNVTYKGIDYLQVDLATRLVYNATSSSDLVNYYTALGDDVIAQNL